MKNNNNNTKIIITKKKINNKKKKSTLPVQMCPLDYLHPPRCTDIESPVELASP
jgi:hypothetical protein